MSLYEKFLQKNNVELHSSSLAILCNHVSYDPSKGKYFFEIIAEKNDLKKVFIPEHGFFAELQDQDTLDVTSRYKLLSSGVKFISLYTSRRDKLEEDLRRYLKDIDMIIIDLQDIGSRYFTYLGLIGTLFECIHRNKLPVTVHVIDRFNPAGRQVEGSMLKKEYASLVGYEGVPHRHGLTIGEMCYLIRDGMNAHFPIKVMPAKFNKKQEWWSIFPSPNMPGPITPKLYTGLCLLEGTNVSEGRGTVKPFELFGAPFMQFVFTDILMKFNKKFQGINLRPILFNPTFHKHKDHLCYGCQVHLNGKSFHSLFFGLNLIRFIREFAEEELEFLKGPYEAPSKRTAIEVLCGDKLFIDFLHGKANTKRVVEKLAAEEQAWIKKASDYLIYKEKLFKVNPVQK